MSAVRLKAGNVQPVWAGHPWVYKQAIAEVLGAPAPGASVDVLDPKGRFLGRGFWSPKSALPVRIATTRQDEILDTAWLNRRIEEAYAWRKKRLELPRSDTTGYRLIHAEGDGLPGLIVDMFDDVASVQFLTIGMKERQDDILAAIARVTKARSILEVPNEKAQVHEDITAALRTVRGPEVSELKFTERGFRYEIAAVGVQKTGFYFDQRENRAQVEQWSSGAKVLDAFSFVGAFGLAAARGGAKHVTSVDSSATAVAIGAQNAERAGLGDQMSFVRADVRRMLTDAVAKREKFDVVILDPPKLVPTTKHLEAGQRAYRKLNSEGLRLVEPGGLFVTCSCSAAMHDDMFLRTISLAAADAGRQVVVLELRSQGPDHPVPVAFPEGRYLKCLFARVR